MHLNGAMLFEKYGKPLFKTGQRMLEIGPDGIPSTYQDIVGDPRWIGGACNWIPKRRQNGWRK